MTGIQSRARAALFAWMLAVLVVATAVQASDDELPYIGEWSNGRGEMLVITEKTIRFGEDRALAYKDVTRATDGSTFELQITARGTARPFGGNTLGLHCEGDSMKITAYASHAAYMQGGDAQSVVTWFKDEESEDE